MAESSTTAPQPLHPQRRAISAPNLRDRPSGSQPVIVLHPTWAEQPAIPNSAAASPAAAAVAPPVVPPARRARRVGDNGWRYWWRTLRAFLGFGPGNEARKDVVQLIFTLSWGTAQILSIVLLLAAAGISPSTRDPSVSEWQACDKPLAPWAILWCIRVVVGFMTAIWAYRISRRRLSRTAPASTDLENARPHQAPANNRGPPAPPFLENPGPQQAPVNNRGPAPQQAPVNNRGPPAPQFPAGGTPGGNGGAVQTPPQRGKKTLARITTLNSLFSLVWFIVAHAFLYGSFTTCRITSPHLWWAVFGIVCIGYIVVAEVFIVGFLVFILVPLVFLMLNIILVCLGRRPLIPGADINPEVPKLSQKLVDRIPLVLYIPPPPDASGPAVPPPVHTYPPQKPELQSPVEGAPHQRSFFRFLRPRRRRTAVKDKGKEKDVNGAPASEAPAPGNAWEDKWEKGEFPFVRLEDNRAACAICLMDFEPPKRIQKSIDEKTAGAGPEYAHLGDVAEPRPDADESEEEEERYGEEDDNLRLQDAGEGVQPLRLLSCGHVFHKTCLDPWLVDVSGRCPTCQQKVDIPEPPSNNERRRRGARDA